MAKKNIIPILLFVLIAISHFLLVYSPRDIDLFEQSVTLRDVKTSQSLEFDLVPQRYFLKIKLFKNAEDNILPKIYFNNVELKKEFRKTKESYIKLYFNLDKSAIGKNNILRIEFDKTLPESILLGLSNSRKGITKDIIIFPLDKQFLRSGKSPFLGSFLILILMAGLWVFIFLIFKSVFNIKNYAALATRTFFPFACVNLILVLPVIFGHKIVITPFIFRFLLVIFVSLPILFYGIRQYLAYSKSNNGINKNIIFYFISFCVTFLIFYSVCELFARVYLKYNYPVKIFKIVDKDISYVLNPGAELNFANGLAKINKDGYRGRACSVNKPGGSKRLVFLGDSMVFGFGLNEEETLSEQISVILNKKQKTESINFAVTGYNTHQERLLFQKKVLSYGPDILILGFCLNDIGGGLHTPTAFNTLNEIGELNYRHEDFSIMEKAQYILSRHSYFYQYLFYKWRIFTDKFITKRADYKPLTLSFMKWELNKDMIKALDLFKQDITQLKELCDKNNIKFIITAYGNELQFDDVNLRMPQRWLEEFCRENNIYFLDLLPAFQGFSKDKVLIDQGHPSGLGNKILAEYLYNFLKENNLLN